MLTKKTNIKTKKALRRAVILIFIAIVSNPQAVGRDNKTEIAEERQPKNPAETTASSSVDPAITEVPLSKDENIQSKEREARDLLGASPQARSVPRDFTALYNFVSVLTGEIDKAGILARSGLSEDMTNQLLALAKEPTDDKINMAIKSGLLSCRNIDELVSVEEKELYNLKVEEINALRSFREKLKTSEALAAAAETGAAASSSGHVPAQAPPFSIPIEDFLTHLPQPTRGTHGQEQTQEERAGSSAQATGTREGTRSGAGRPEPRIGHGVGDGTWAGAEVRNGSETPRSHDPIGRYHDSNPDNERDVAGGRGDSRWDHTPQSSAASLSPRGAGERTPRSVIHHSPRARSEADGETLAPIETTQLQEILHGEEGHRLQLEREGIDGAAEAAAADERLGSNAPVPETTPEGPGTDTGPREGLAREDETRSPRGVGYGQTFESIIPKSRVEYLLIFKSNAGQLIAFFDERKMQISQPNPDGSRISPLNYTQIDLLSKLEENEIDALKHNNFIDSHDREQIKEPSKILLLQEQFHELLRDRKIEDAIALIDNNADLLVGEGKMNKRIREHVRKLIQDNDRFKVFIYLAKIKQGDLQIEDDSTDLSPLPPVPPMSGPTLGFSGAAASSSSTPTPIAPAVAAAQVRSSGIRGQHFPPFQFQVGPATSYGTGRAGYTHTTSSPWAPPAAPAAKAAPQPKSLGQSGPRAAAERRALEATQSPPVAPTTVPPAPKVAGVLPKPTAPKAVRPEVPKAKAKGVPPKAPASKAPVPPAPPKAGALRPAASEPTRLPPSQPREPVALVPRLVTNTSNQPLPYSQIVDTIFPQEVVVVKPATRISPKHFFIIKDSSGTKKPEAKKVVKPRLLFKDVNEAFVIRDFGTGYNKIEQNNDLNPLQEENLGEKKQNA